METHKVRRLQHSGRTGFPVIRNHRHQNEVVEGNRTDVRLAGGISSGLANQQSYHGDCDFVFASDKLNGKKPRTGQMVNRGYLKPAAIAAKVIQPGERFGFHSLRHSLSTWVNNTTTDVKIAQTMLRHSRPEITAGIYIHGVPEANLKAQEQYVAAMMKGGNSPQANAQDLMKAKPASASIHTVGASGWLSGWN